MNQKSQKIAIKRINMPKKKYTISTFKEFHKLVPSIAKEINKKPELCCRGLANPIFAIEELGYEISDDVKRTIEHYLLYTKKERKQLSDLKKEMEKIAGRDFDPDSDKDIEKLLFNEIKIRKPKDMKPLERPDPLQKADEKIKKIKKEWKDSLERIKNKHPIVAPLLEYRKCAMNKPQFTSRKLYDQLKNGERKLPISKIKINFNANPANHKEVEDA